MSKNNADYVRVLLLYKEQPFEAMLFFENPSVCVKVAMLIFQNASICKFQAMLIFESTYICEYVQALGISTPPLAKDPLLPPRVNTGWQSPFLVRAPEGGR